jgi:DNA invertase Pin-like site-specific DNA recombinase
MADIAYRRVSSIGQKTDRQLDGLVFDKEFLDKVSAGTTNRPGLKACLDFIREGDTLHVHSIDRLCRNLSDLQKIVTDLNEKGIAIHFHKENLVFTGKNNAMNKLTMQLLGAVAEFEKALINERQLEGIAKAKAGGKHLGRSAALTTEQVEEILKRKEAGEQVVDLAGEFAVSRQTIYQSIKRAAEVKI